MKSILPITLIGVLILSGLFLAFTDSSESEFLNEIQLSKKVIADQTYCIDDLEASLYDFSFEISELRTQNEFLLQENEDLRSEIKSQAQRAAKYRNEIVTFQEENYNLKRQLDQVLIGREIRARHQANNANFNIADNMTNDASMEIDQEITELQSQINTITSEIEEREVAIHEINQQTAETLAEITANETKVEFNIEMEPSSDPSIEFNDPMVSNGVLYDAPVEAPKLFSSLQMVHEDDHSDLSLATTEDEFTSKSPIYSLIENTDITYNYVACRNDRYGRKIKKLKRDGMNWKYTFVQFNLENDNINLLLNQEFRLRVLSTDLNKYVNFHTDKQKLHGTYYDFIYEGEPVKVSIFNDAIIGKSFDLQIFYIVDGEEYLLEDDQRQLFLEGVSVKTDVPSEN